VNIGIYVFNLCFGLTEVNLPDTMTVLPESFLKSCTSLRTIHLPESLTEIGRYALASTGLVSIELPHGITHIPDSLFNSCKSLQSVTIPSSVTSIGQDAFYYCLGLESLTLPEGVTTLESFAFQHCHELKELVIPSSLTHIGRAAFIYCYELSSLSLPQGLQSIDKEAFSNCGATVTIHPDNPYFVAKDGIIYNKDMTQILYVSDHVTEAIIPAGVKDIQSAFSYHTQLKKISFEAGSAITQIPSGAFYGCSELSEIILPAGVKTIGNSAFYECKSLRYIEIPEGVTLIDAYAFAYSSNLETVIFPDSVTSISSYAFYECTGLVFMNLPKDLKSIGDSAFSRCFALPRLDLPEGLTSIGYSAFSACRNLTTVVLPQSLTSLGTYAFGSCESLYQIINRSDITLTLGSTNSDDITYYTKILTDKQGNVSYATDSSGGAYIVVDNFLYICRNDTYTMLAYLGNEASVTLPTDVNGHAYTIQKLRGVTRLTLPEGVTEIPSSAFGDCYSLVEINLPESLLSIGHGAFYGCENLRTVTIPDRVHLVDTSAFAYCTKLSSVTLSESLTAIGDAVFSNCSSLAQIDIPDGVTNIGSSAFANCSSLRSITIPDNVTNLGSSAFANCSALETIVLGDNITSIGADVFTETAYAQNPENWENGCLYIGNYLFDVDEQLTAYILPEGVKVIAEDAFENCHLIKTVSIGGNHPKLLADLTNVETLVITEMPTGYVYSYFGRFPSTLRNVVLEKDVKISARSLLNLTNATIYVADSEKDTQWDENFPGWHQGNAVVYGDKWINVVFHDENGVILSSQIFKTSAIIRQPYMGDRTDDIYRYIFMGYDMNGDGSPDTIPATSTADLHAYAVYAREYRCVKEGHLYGDQIVINAPTCTTDGLACQDCVYCGHRKNTAIDALGHVYESQVTLPTCTEQGYTTHSCTRCQETYRDTVTAPLGHKAGSAATCTDAQTCTVCGTILTAALGHEYDQAVIHPTCTEQGYTKNTCLRCGDVYCDAWTLPLGHKTDSPATCTEAQLCTVCGTVVTPALGHSFSSVVTPPTCTELGYTTYTCYRCEESYTDTWRAPTGHSEGPEADCVSDQICLVCGITLVKAYGHDYIPTVTPPTCTAQGYTTFSCNRCDESYRDVWTDPVPHTPGADATCTEDQLCSVCGTVTTPALGHSYDPVVTPPTCTEQGYTTYVCTRCDNSYKTLWTQATGHSKGPEANCTDNQICTVCGILLVKAYGHDYLPTVTEPTCTAQGYTTFSCSQCHESYRDVWTDPVPHTPGADATCTEDQLCTVCGTVVTPAMGHSYDSVVTPPTCTEEGFTTYTCASCQDSFVAEHTPITEHSYHSVVTPPSCTEEGYTTHTCTVCGFIIRDDITSPSGHVPGEEPTCTEHQYCITCGKILTQKLWHDYDTTVIPASCLGQGHTIYNCRRCGHSYVSNYTPVGDHVAGAAPTCTEDQVCTVCNSTLADKLGHDNTSVVTDPTCTEEGYTTHTCNRCGFVCTDTYVEPLGHTEGNRADCLNDQTCTACGVILAERLGHDYSLTVFEPSCTEEGYTEYRCNRCGDQYQDDFIKPLGHAKGAEPDCENDQICTTCGIVLTERFGHDYESSTTPPTCTEAGSVICTCTRCGDSYLDGEPAPLGHSSSCWIVDLEPAPGIEGQKHLECTVCGEILESAIIEALPLETESETDLEIDLETNGLTDPDIEPETKPNHETDGEISSGTEYETQPDIFPETEGESKQPVETETVGESQNGAITEKAPAGGGCSGNIFSSISLLMLAFPALFMALKRKKETE